MSEYFLEALGVCPICEAQVTFRSKYSWLRDHLICPNCESIPRERALMEVIKKYFPHYRELDIHESSPGGGGVSARLKAECPGYSESQLFHGVAVGQLHPEFGVRCENLENLSFVDGRFDLFITQDVMEHVFSPKEAFSEIARVLKEGGAHIFTAPLVNKEKPSERWAALGESGVILYLHEPEYHGNPVDPNGSLVTMHWGYDICEYISRCSGMVNTLIYIDDIHKGIRAEYIEVICSRKPVIYR